MRRCTASQSPSPAHKSAAPISVSEVSTPARRYTAATGGSGRSDREVRGEADRSAAAEGWGSVVVVDGEK